MTWMRKHRRAERQRHANRRGIALLLTLGILLLLTLLALSFSSSQLTENQAARNFYHGTRAEEIALGGLETAIAVLREDSKFNPYDSRSCSDHHFERWGICYEDDDGFAAYDLDPDKATDLSDYDELEYGVDEDADIFNERIDPWDETRLDEKLDSRWIGDKARNAITGKEYLVWRFAVCIEDENAKVNINTAGNPDPLSTTRRWTHRQNMGFTTAEINLGAVFGDPNLGLRRLFSDLFPNLGMNDYPYNVSADTALDIVAYRHGYDDTPWGKTPTPGRESYDDNSTSQTNRALRQDRNGIDDDGDLLIDEEEEEKDEPGEFDPYEPMETREPADLLLAPNNASGTPTVFGNDMPLLTVANVKMAKSVSRPPNFAVKDMLQKKDPYPLDRIYRSLLPYITVYSQDVNRFSSKDIQSRAGRGGIEWYVRENIGRRWLEAPSEVYDFLRFLKSEDIAFGSMSDDTLKQVAVNLYDFIDPDWFPTEAGDVIGIEVTVYVNEVEPSPPLVPGTQLGIEGYIEDYGEYIELWNPYTIPIDVGNYYVTTGTGSPTPIRSMNPASTVIPPEGFFVIGDTLGDVVNTGQGTRSEQTLAPYPPGCQAYAPLKLPPSGDMVLELRVGREDFPIEKSRYSGSEDRGNLTAQKDDPRVSEWRSLAGTFRTFNANMTNRDAWQTYFYMPGIKSRSQDGAYLSAVASGDQRDIMAILEHAGALTTLGELGMVHRGKPWQSLNFTGENLLEPDDEDDGRLLDILTFPYQYEYEGPVAQTDEVPARRVVPGRININTASPEVLLGLNWDRFLEDLSSYGLRGSPAARNLFIRRILERRKEPPSDKRGPYKNLADVARDVAEFMESQSAWSGAPEAAVESFMRYNSNLITTRSNVFKITVLAEVFDGKGHLAAQRKLEAVVDRGFTPGRLGRPGEKAEDIVKAETPRTLYFRWITED